MKNVAGIIYSIDLSHNKILKVNHSNENFYHENDVS